MRLLFILLSPLGLRAAEKLIKTSFNSLPARFLLERSSYFKITAINISKCFKNNKNQHNKNLAYQSLVESIFSVYETIYSWSRNESKISSLIFKQENRFMLKAKYPKLLYTIHNRSIDMLLSFLMLENQVTTLYKTIKNQRLNKYVIEQRSKNNSSVATASIGGVRAALKSLNSGINVCFGADQVPADGLGVNSYFFKSVCYSSNLVEAISKREGTGTCFVYLTKNDFGYVVAFDHLSSSFVGTDKMNQLFERSICKKPEEYSWEYKKFRKVSENKELYKF